MPSSNTTEANGSAGQGQPAAGEIDLKALAEKIYKLLKKEARLERERLGRLRTG